MSARYPLVRNLSALSTRSGVRKRPSRAGSSPSLARISRICGTMVCSSCLGDITFTVAGFDFIGFNLKDVAGSLGDADPLELGPLARKSGTPAALEPTANLDGQVLRRRDRVRERLHFGVQVAAVEGLEDAPHHDLIERRRVHGAPRHGVQGTARTHLQHVVVAVPIRIVALEIGSES